MTARVLALALVVGVAACSPLAPRPDPSRFYLLTAIPEDEIIDPGPALPALVLGVGPIAMPAYLRRLEIVTRVDPNRVELSEFDRWAEPLETNVVRILAANLSHLLGSEQIVPFPWFGPTRPDLAIEITVRRFERQPNDTVELWTRWVVRDWQRRTVLDQGEIELGEPAAPGTDAQVEAQSVLLGGLSRALATVVRRAYGSQRQGARP